MNYLQWNSEISEIEKTVIINSCMLGKFAGFLSSADFLFKINFFKKSSQEYHQSVIPVKIQIIIFLVLIWVQTVWKCYEQMTKEQMLSDDKDQMFSTNNKKQW